LAKNYSHSVKIILFILAAEFFNNSTCSLSLPFSHTLQSCDNSGRFSLFMWLRKRRLMTNLCCGFPAYMKSSRQKSSSSDSDASSDSDQDSKLQSAKSEV